MSRLQECDQVVHIVTTVMRGGAENQLVILIREQIKNGLLVKVIFLKGKDELVESLNDMGAVVICDFANKHSLRQLSLMNEFLKSDSGLHSIIHAHLPRAQIMAAFAKTRSQKLICSRHDEDKFYPKGNNLVSKFLFKIVDHKTTKWIAISDSVRKSMEKHKETIHGSKLEVVHYGISQDEDLSAPIESNFTKLFDQEKLVIGCVARLVHQKDHETLIKGFAHFSKAAIDARLIIVGDGPLLESLQKLAKEFEISDKIVWTGRVDDVYRYYRQMDIFVLASKTEGFGLVLLEAMQYGIPVIGADNSAIPEVIGEAGLLFNPGDSRDLANKLTALSNPIERSRLSVAGQKRIAQFAPQIMEMKIRKIYREAGAKL